MNRYRYRYLYEAISKNWYRYRYGGPLKLFEPFEPSEPNESVFIPNIYASIWVKIRTKTGRDKIIGNIYRPNTAPLANIELAIQMLVYY